MVFLSKIQKIDKFTLFFYNTAGFLTIGDVGRICGRGQYIVRKWFDSGKLGGYRFRGEKGHRRIPRKDLIAFLQARGLLHKLISRPASLV